MADGATLPLGTAEVRVTANISELQPGFDRAQTAAQNFERLMQRQTSEAARHFVRMSREIVVANTTVTRSLAAFAPGLERTQEAARRFERAMADPTSAVARRFARMAADVRHAAAATADAAAAAAALEPAHRRGATSADRFGDSIGRLVNRYVGWIAIMNAARRLAMEAIRTNDEATAAAGRLGEAYTDLAQNLGPTIATMTDWLTSLVVATNNVVKGVKAAAEEIARAPIFGGFKGPLGAGTRQSGSARLDSTSKNWTPGPFGFPESGSTDLAEIATAEKAASDARQKGYDVEADAIHALSLARKAMYDDWRVSEDKRRAEFDKGIRDSLRLIGETGFKLEIEREAALERELEQALEYLERLGEESTESSAKRTEGWIADQQRAFDEVAAYWENITYQMDAIGKDFFSEFTATGIADFESMADKMISTWTSTLYDMAKQGKLFGEGGLFGGSGGGLGGILNTIAPMVAKWLPIAGAVVGMVQKIFAPKPSDNRSVATFVPGMTDFGFGAQSAHESSDSTLGGVQQAAEAIQKDISALKAAGVEFTQELLNIWLGERDESTFQLSGGGRVGTGSIGDAKDLALDALNAMLGTAKSADPKIAAILKSGGGIEDIQKYLVEAQVAKDFATSITDALLEITDPLEYALTIWERTARANLAMAEQTGFSLDKVREFNAALYQQMMAQQNAGAIASVTGLMGQLQHGSMSSAAPGVKYEAGLAEFEKLRDAALGGGAKEAEAFAQFSAGWLPQAHDYLGTSKAYGMLESSTLSTLSTLLSGLQAPQTMPDLTVPLQAGFSMTVGSIEQLTEEVKGLRADNQNLALQLSAMARQVPA